MEAGSCSLRKFTVDRLHLHGEGDQSWSPRCPKALKRAIAELRPTGPINLNGERLDFSKTSQEARLATAWDVEVVSAPGQPAGRPQVGKHFRRACSLTGSSDGARYSSRGELDFDSATYKNFQFTQVIGPLWFDNDNACLGDWRCAGGRNRRVTAQVARRHGRGRLPGQARHRRRTNRDTT